MTSSRSARTSIALGVGALAALLGLGAPGLLHASPPLTGVDLSTYVRVGRFDLPEPTRTAAPAGSLLAQEASAVTYNWDTDTLFICGDGGTSVVQVTKTGQLIDSMSLATGSSPQGTEFYDTEGLAYVGGGKFVMTEERYRQVVRFTYVAGTTLTRGDVETVKLGTTIGNVGLEGVAHDPLTGGLLLVKEKTPKSIFSTAVDWAAGTATNGSPATVASTDLFDPALIPTTDLSDVFALATVSTLTGADVSHLLVISQESGKIVNVDRSGTVFSTLTIQADAGNPLTVPDQTNEGVTMDDDGTIYVVNEAGGGDGTHPQLWVYKPTDAENLAPTGVLLSNVLSSLPENTSTLGGIRVADVTVLDDGLGVNDVTLSGTDAASFQVLGGSLFLRAGTVLDFETKPHFVAFVNVNDATVGATPDASVLYTLDLTDVAGEAAAPGTVVVSEAAPWSSGNSPVGADWFEVTNLGATAVDITGWKVDDNSYSSGAAVALRMVTSIPGGRSAIFLESGTTANATVDGALVKAFCQNWWASDTPPAGVQVGVYGGSGIGLSTGGDAVNLFTSAGVRVTGFSFGTASATSPFRTFDNTAGIGGTTTPAPAVTLLSVVGTNGAFQVTHPISGTPVSEVGSPGVDYVPPTFSNVPLDIVAEATGTATSVAFVPPTATDLVDGVRPVVCTPASPGPFPLGTSTVVCTASDLAGNVASVSFHVTVVDTRPPLVLVPSTITVEATGPLTEVLFGPVMAVDAVDGPLVATCSPASPGPFPVGTTHVDCFAVDAHGNRGAGLFNVTVVDTTPPAVTVPADITVDATGPTGAVVSYVASTTDLVGLLSFVCVPASGSTFPIGDTTVTCTAIDLSGNTTVRTFHVHVNGAAEQLDDLHFRVTGVGPGKSLEGKVSAIQGKVAAGDTQAACNMLKAFINEVNAQFGKKIAPAVAAALIEAAMNIRAVLGC